MIRDGESFDVITIDGCPIHYKLIGSSNKPLLVFIHAGLLDHHMFDKQIATLKLDFRLLLWDLRGHGLSQPEGEIFTVNRAVGDLVKLLKHIHAQKVILVGSSLGGIIAQEYAQQFPKTVQALIWTDGACVDIPLTTQEKLLLKIFILLIEFKIPNPLATHHMRTKFQKDTQEYLSKVAHRIPHKTKMHIWHAIYAHISQKKLTQYSYDIPIMFGRGEYDFPYTKHMIRVSKLFPKGEYIVIPHAGHIAQYDNPDFFNTVVLEFLQKSKK